VHFDEVNARLFGYFFMMMKDYIKTSCVNNNKEKEDNRGEKTPTRERQRERPEKGGARGAGRERRLDECWQEVPLL
jgi:hypothetical protein